MSTPDQTSKSGKGPKIDLSSLSSQIKKDARAQCFPPTSPNKCQALEVLDDGTAIKCSHKEFREPSDHTKNQ